MDVTKVRIDSKKTDRAFLYYAVKEDDLSEVKRLLKSGVDTNSRDILGRTVLMEVRDSDIGVAIVKELIKHGADINLTAVNGNNALHDYVLLPSERLINIAIQSGINVNHSNMFGVTPLLQMTHTAQDGNIQEALDLLVTGGADIRAQAENGMCLAERAYEHSNFELILALVKYDIEKLINGHYWSSGNNIRCRVPLMFGIAGHSDFFVKMVESGYDIHEESVNGETVLFITTEYFNTDNLKLLIKLGADVNHTNREGKSAIFLAIHHGMYEHFEILLDAGSDLTIRDNTGKSVIDYFTEWHITDEYRRRFEKKILALSVDCGDDISLVL